MALANLSALLPRPCPAPARAQLFNVVVDNEETASVVIEHLVKTKAGRVTLVPLSRIHSPPVEYPNDSDVRPLMSFLTYDAAHRAAVEQVFSKILLCRSLEVASKVRRGRGGPRGPTRYIRLTHMDQAPADHPFLHPHRARSTPSRTA